MITYTNDIGLY